MPSYLLGLECRACCTELAADHLIGPCPTCGHTLFARYDLARMRAELGPETWTHRPSTLWRFQELLPVEDPTKVLTLGEGGSPILELDAAVAGVEVHLKDDGQMPTGSFKARGMAVAVSRARELGARELFVPSAGNAGVALAAYAARGRLPARIYLPDSTPASIIDRCERFGATVIPLSGTLLEVGRQARELEKGQGGFDLSTLREPYRVEGKKTAGLEIFQQMPEEWFPDVIVFPTGGGTGIVGMFKAFNELRSLGWLSRTPRLIAVQTAGCAPVVQAIETGASAAVPWPGPATSAPGLLVPGPFASERILEAIRQTHGTAIAVEDAKLREGVDRLERSYGVSVSIEGAAPLAALPALLARGDVRSGDRVLLYNTGSGMLYPELAR